MPAVTELFAALADHIVVGIGRHHPWSDAQALFHFFEPGRHFSGGVALHIVFFSPVFERGFWCSKARSPVDQRSAAHRPALEDGDRAILAHAAYALLVEAGVGLVFEQFEVAAGLERAFLDQQHLVTGGAEDFGRGPAAGTAADDRHIRFEGQVLGQLGAVVGFPATGHAFAERVGYGHLNVL
ncbi:hypothetical protein D3C76_948560 [compost metagenome]